MGNLSVRYKCDTMYFGLQCEREDHRQLWSAEGNMIQQKEKRPFGDIAHMSALKPEEIEEAAREAEESGSASEEAGTQETEKKDYGYVGAKQDAAAAKLIRMEHEAPIYTVTPKPDQQTMFKFLLYHTYLNPMGMIAFLLGVAALVLAIMGIINGATGPQLILFVALAAFFVANSPLTMIAKAKKYSQQTADPENAITYTFSSRGFDLARLNGDYAQYEWNTFAKIKETGNAYFCYLAKNQAFVIPKADLGEDEQGFRALLLEKVDAKKLRLAKDSM